MSLSLFHRDLGGSGQPPLILLHGLLGSSRNWQTAGADLAARYHVLALDLRNHGRSPHADDMSYEAMMADVIAWMDERKIALATVMGHSMGGKVTMLLACRQPARVKQLIVVDIAPKDYLSAAHRGELAAMNELDLTGLQSRAEAELRFEARVPDWGMRKFLTTNLERDPEGGDGWRWVINLPGLTAALIELEKSPLTERDGFAGPTHFICGGRSRYFEPGDWKKIADHFPAAKLTVIEESGHNPHMETRETFVRAVMED